MSSRVCLASAGGRSIAASRCIAANTRARLVRAPGSATRGPDIFGAQRQRLERLQATSNDRETDTEKDQATVDDTKGAGAGVSSEPGENGVVNASSSPADTVSSGIDTTRLSTEEIQKQMGELRRAKEEQDAAMAAKEDSLVSGVMEEVGLIQWPSFGSAFVNTLLVIAIVFGTSLVLFGVNTLLTELSGVIYSS